MLTFAGNTDKVIEVSTDNDLPDSVELHLGKRAHLKFVDDFTVLILHGDDTCLITVPNGVTLTVQAVPNQLKGIQCKLTIEEGGTLLFNGNLVISQQLSLSGRLGAERVEFAPLIESTIYGTGVLDSKKVEVGAEAIIHVKSGGKFTSQNSEYLTLNYKAKVELFVSEFDAPFLTMRALSELILTDSEKSFTLDVKEFLLEDNSVISVSGGGNVKGPGAGSATMGASYGGEGGNSKDKGYGSIKTPTEAGSGTGTARGGGKIVLKVVNICLLDGKLMAEGDNSDDAGGASGGLIHVSCGKVAGHGEISVKGGNSSVSGGGGGGRVVVASNTNFANFHGSVLTHGGQGSTHSGASGTVYVEGSNPEAYSLYIDNNGQKTPAQTIINDISLVLTKVDLRGQAIVAFSKAEANVEMKKVTGDYTSTVVIASGQKTTIASQSGKLKPFALPLKIRVESNGTAIMPSKTLLTNNNQDNDSSLYVEGEVLNLDQLSVGRGGKAFYSHSKSSKLLLTELNVLTDGKIELGLDSDEEYILTTTKDTNVKYGGTIVGKFLTIKASKLQIAYSGVINANGNGYEAETGTGAGQGSSGASYGGTGGTSMDTSFPADQVYGTYRSADEYGSGGGSGSGQEDVGGAGGGKLVLDIETQITLHGSIQSDGGAGIGKGGGGSGGSIHIMCNGISGSGQISVQGGSAGTGGGGGGGRVLLAIEKDYDYSGTLVLKGGNSVSSMAGGAGTTFMVRTEGGLQVEELFTNNAGISSHLESIAPTVINVDPPTDGVDKLNIGKDVLLHFVTPKLTFTAKKLTCGEGSIVTIKDEVILHADKDETSTITPCSFHLKENGELRLPSIVTFKGKDNKLEGK